MDGLQAKIVKLQCYEKNTGCVSNYNSLNITIHITQKSTMQIKTQIGHSSFSIKH